jgi:hypothetical protein
MRNLPIAVVLAFTRHHWDVLGLVPAAMIARSSMKSQSLALGSISTRSVIRDSSTSSLLYASLNEESSAADNLLRMVEEISNDQFSPEVISKMTELEQALTAFLEEQTQEKYQNKWSPRPPGTPPPLRMLQNTDGTTPEVSLAKAEIALEKLRARLRREEEALRRAEEALQQSMQEEEILRRAEEALQRSREAADERKLQAIRQTEAAAASAEKARKDTEEAHQVWNQEQPTSPFSSSDYEAVQEQDSYTNVEFFNHDDESIHRGMEAPRSTIPLDFLLGSNGSPLYSSTDINDVRDDYSQAPAGTPILSNWVQYIDGSIHGQVRNSDKFPDGASISTSAVEQGTTGGTVIETSSGSK